MKVIKVNLKEEFEKVDKKIAIIMHNNLGRFDLKPIKDIKNNEVVYYPCKGLKNCRDEMSTDISIDIKKVESELTMVVITDCEYINEND